MLYGPNDITELARAPYTGNVFSVSSFRTVGVFTGDINVFAIQLAANATKRAILLWLTASWNVGSALAGGGYQIACGRGAALATGGTSLASRVCAHGTGSPTAAAAVLGATASDGGAATAITLAAITARHMSETIPHIPFGVTIANGVSMPINTQKLLKHPLALAPGDSFAVQSPTGLDTLYAVTINCGWAECPS